ncbi:MAG: hybrid sensor histidine kinase/response regulator [Anaerolineae bacterium]|nr:hybrid sensor histidine kinase/response regulator [Anaerolineae bacterium]
MTGAKTILYIEDDPASRTLVERTLRFAGYEVHVAACGLEGVDIARATELDMILTDINLPDISGREVTTMLRGEPHLRHVPIVALTAQTLDEQREVTMAAGITGYLTKPIDVEALPGQIEHYLNGAQDLLDAERLADAQKRYTHEVVTRLEARIRELERTNDKLRRLDKMKDSFIQLTAHELRTPLTLVYGYSRLLEDSPTLKPVLRQDETAQSLAHGLVEAVERMQVIVNEIVTVSRIMTHQIDMSIGPVNLVTMMQKVLKQYEAAFQKRHQHVTFDPTGWPRKLLGDGELLTLAIGNLISNAIKYTPDDGHITITATGGEDDICIRIKDTGIGVARDEQTRIFDRFHTAEDTLLHSTSKTAYRGGGLGLGLAVCKAVIEAHGGSIRVESPGFDPERLPGSEFIVVLPVISESSEHAG